MDVTEKEQAILWLGSFVKNKEPMILVPKPLIRLMYDVLTQKSKTNYDRIVSKSPEELAEWLEAHCYQYGWLDWLKQEATE